MSVYGTHEWALRYREAKIKKLQSPYYNDQDRLVTQQEVDALVEMHYGLDQCGPVTA